MPIGQEDHGAVPATIRTITAIPASMGHQ
jgi:hypothetical protein